jgi:light-harvesting complex II chlorophyll a/b binding protein 4
MMLAQGVKVVAATQRKTVAPKKAVKKVALNPGAADRQLWLPNTVAPEWLDGSLPGDSGFDPLGLAKPAEFLQFDLDKLEQSGTNRDGSRAGVKNKAGEVLGKLVYEDNKPKRDALQPYDSVFELNRFRETELIHGRWAMLATLGCVVAELNTGVNWVDAGKVELEQGSSYAGLPLPFDITQLCILEAILMGGVEVLRNTELDPEKRIYPGGAFDPLGLAKEEDPELVFRLRTAEIKHSRLAMVAMFGFASQAGATRTGSLLDNLSSIFPV